MRFTIPFNIADRPATEDAALWRLLQPLHTGLNSLAAAVFTSNGNVEYSQQELQSIDQLLPLRRPANIIYPRAAVSIPYGALISLAPVSGKLEAALADNSPGTGTRAVAICNAPAGAAPGEFFPAICISGFCAGVSGSTLGAPYWLGTAGTMIPGPPVTPGAIIQPVATGFGNSGIFLNIV